MSEIAGTNVPKQTYSSPMSFVGSARRLTGWAKRQEGALAVLAWLAVAVALPCFWMFLLLWYVIAFGVFGVITVPLRLMRRGQRKSQAIQEAQLRAMQEALKNQPQR